MSGVRLVRAEGHATTPAHVGQHDVPSTLMGVTVLGYPDQLVEIEAVAVVLACAGD